MCADSLKKIRVEIDTLDREIQRLINERARCAQRVAEIKLAAEDNPVFYRPEREAEILREVKARNEGPLSDHEMARLFREIMSSCLALELPMRVGYLGPEGTFTQSAVLKHFGHAVVAASYGAIDEVFRAVEADEAAYGVVPVENSTEGAVNHTLDTFITSPLKICGEVELRIHHFLMSADVELGAVKRLYSHHQSFAQCREWLDAKLPGVERIPVSSNSEAAKRAAQDQESAAIAGEIAAEIYDLSILARKIEDNPNNTTRFLVIGKSSPPPSGVDKTSILVSAPNRPGALFNLLEPLHQNGVSMTRIESRPSKQGMWDYVFFIDVEGHASEPRLAEVLPKLEDRAAMMKVLGAYPVGVLG